jgi:hypothetical protein
MSFSEDPTQGAGASEDSTQGIEVGEKPGEHPTD